MNEQSAMWLATLLCVVGAFLTGWDWEDSKAKGGAERTFAWIGAVLITVAFSWVYFMAIYWLFPEWRTRWDSYIVGAATATIWLSGSSCLIGLGLWFDFERLRQLDWRGASDEVLRSLQRQRLRPDWAVHNRAEISAGASGNWGGSSSGKSRRKSSGGDAGKGLGGLIGAILFVLRFIIALVLGVLTTWMLIRFFARLRANFELSRAAEQQ